ncbi:KptA family-domain-containing protein [Myxozyma melibiosi]|uniref:2'-phosphotransferase n=1 Tax=Myxozyma melibiosi TaxID=54550 RepID=A0ABR1FC45_9ASCO
MTDSAPTITDNATAPTPDRSANLTRASRRLVSLLRHKAVAENLPIGSDGYVRVDDLLSRKLLGPTVTLADVKSIVAADNKTRFKLDYRGPPISTDAAAHDDPQHWFVRANQGHTMPHIQIALREITDASEVAFAVHGTNARALPSILRHGLSVAARQHIHLAQRLPDDTDVVSGMRSSSDVLIYIDLKHALADGVDFYESDNGVVLTSGDNGVLHPRYFEKVLRVPDKQHSESKKFDISLFEPVEFEREVEIEPVPADLFDRNQKRRKQPRKPRPPKSDQKTES